MIIEQCISRRCFRFVVPIVQSGTASDTDYTNDVDDHVDQVTMDDLLPYGHREKRRRKGGSHRTHHTTRHLCEAINRSNQVLWCRFSDNNLDRGFVMRTNESTRAFARVMIVKYEP